MTHNIKKALVELAEHNADYEAVETFSKMINIFVEEAGLKYGTDFILKGVKKGKLHFSFMDVDSFNLAIRTLRGE